jgi:hypothetical protein
VSAATATLLARHTRRGILIDTNLMLLLLVGTYDLARIATFKRTLKYAASDYALLLDLISRFSRRLTAPNVLTEVDNLARQLPAREHADISAVFRRLMTRFVEIYRPSDTAMRTRLFETSGLTDTVIFELAEEYLILTDDFPLANRLDAAGRSVINMNHLRL